MPNTKRTLNTSLGKYCKIILAKTEDPRVQYSIEKQNMNYFQTLKKVRLIAENQ